ncbi:MAG: tetratricopeptide repeat protein [Planctomycetaceae bacterium]|nr:tetratricopeptide repeat protein [Planctomycetales bacterium]MCB9925720.1 tetratricopeptide repeat protein [Planctomycetaceae bacterium]
MFRCLAVLLGLLPLPLCELTLRLVGIGELTEASYPEIGFESIHPLFVLNTAGDRYEIAKNRRAYFYPDSFAAKKDAGEFRVFCLGGSTVQGRPYSIETSFTTWLELSLNAADPRRKWEVVNCGGVSYASYRLVPIMRELLAYEPDLFVVYTGHNEFLEARSFANTSPPMPLSRVRTFNFVRSIWAGYSRLEGTGQTREILDAEVNALLDYRGGLSDYHRDVDAQDATASQFGENLEEMINLARSAEVPLVLMNPASNLKDTPPFKIERRADLEDRMAAQFERLLGRARSSSDAAKKIELLESAVAIDGQHAGARFLLAHAYLAQNDFKEARAQFIYAKDEDICPLRMIEPLHKALQSVAEATATPVIDVRGDFEARAADGIPGDGFFLDHIHPSINNHQVIARLLINHLIASGTCKPQREWEAIRDDRYVEHLGTLDTPYYAKGKQRLEGLVRWTQGRANKLRDGTSLPPGLD